MSYKRTKVESLDIKVNSGQKKYVRYKEIGRASCRERV